MWDAALDLSQTPRMIEKHIFGHRCSQSEYAISHLGREFVRTELLLDHVQVLNLTHLSVFDRLLPHLLVLCVLKRFITFLIDYFDLTRDIHYIWNTLLWVFHLTRCQRK